MRKTASRIADEVLIKVGADPFKLNAGHNDAMSRLNSVAAKRSMSKPVPAPKPAKPTPALKAAPAPKPAPAPTAQKAPTGDLSPLQQQHMKAKFGPQGSQGVSAKQFKAMYPSFENNRQVYRDMYGTPKTK